jgi:hypothetical protein
MKTLLLAVALCAATVPALAQTNVSITVGQPGFYGRIDLGDFRAPPVMYAQPIIIERSVHYAAEPIYLRVPPGHAKNWRKHCHRYQACGQRVMFVRDEWYSNTYAPHVRQQHSRGGRDRDHDGDHDRGDHRGGKHKDKGHDKGHGNGKHKD